MLSAVAAGRMLNCWVAAACVAIDTDSPDGSVNGTFGRQGSHCPTIHPHSLIDLNTNALRCRQTITQEMEAYRKACFAHAR